MSLAARKKSVRSKSLSPSSIQLHNTRTCKYRHINKKIDTSSSILTCADCKLKVKKYGIIYGCNRCKFYLCTACIRKPACNNGHILNISHIAKGTICKSCQYKSKKNKLSMYICNKCKYYCCLGCYTYETCSGNHGLKYIKINQNLNKKLLYCHKCKRIFKINKSLFMCKKCKYSLCKDCYQPSLLLKNKILKQKSLRQKIKNNRKQQQQPQPQQPQPLPPPPPPLPLPPSSANVPQLQLNNNNNNNNGYFDDGKDDNKLNLSDSDDDLHDEEEKKDVLLTHYNIANHNNNYNYPQYSGVNNVNNSNNNMNNNNNNNNNNPSYANSYHSYSHSNSYQSHKSHSQSVQSVNASSGPPVHGSQSKKKNNKNKKKKKSKKNKNKKDPNKSPIIHPSTSSAAGVNNSNNNNNHNHNVDDGSSLSLDLLSGIESCTPSEMTRIPSILTDCCICMEREKEVAFLPCGHYIACEKCAYNVKSETGLCAICTTKITSIIKIYE